MSKKPVGGRITSAHMIALLALFVALGGSVYAATTIDGRTIIRQSEPGNRLENDAVTGKQVRESTLGTVPDAGKLGGATLDQLASGGEFQGSCDPTSNTFIDCGTAGANIQYAGEHPLIVATASYDGAGSGAGFRGDCRLAYDGTPVGDTIVNGSSDGTGVGFNSNSPATTSLNVIAPALSRGAHSFSLQCNQAGGSIEYPQTYVAVLMVGPDVN